MSVDTSKFQRVPFIAGESPDETARLLAMSGAATDYLRAFSWCEEIADVFLARGIGDVIALFLVRFAVPVAGTDEGLWVVVGDLPSAYFVLDEAPDMRSALEIYCELMEAWIGAVRHGHDLREVFPVAAEATIENADQLARRIGFVKTEIIAAL